MSFRDEIWKRGEKRETRPRPIGNQRFRGVLSRCNGVDIRISPAAQAVRAGGGWSHSQPGPMSQEQPWGTAGIPQQGREALAAAQGPAGTQHKALMGSMDPHLTVRTNEIEQLSSEGCENSTEPSSAAKAGREQGWCIMHEGETQGTDSKG